MKTRTHTGHLLAKATAALVVAAFMAPAALAGHADGILPPPDAVDRYIGNHRGGVQTFASEQAIPDAVDRYVRNNCGSLQASFRSNAPLDAIDRYLKNRVGAVTGALDLQPDALDRYLRNNGGPVAEIKELSLPLAKVYFR